METPEDREDSKKSIHSSKKRVRSKKKVEEERELPSLHQDWERTDPHSKKRSIFKEDDDESEGVNLDFGKVLKGTRRHLWVMLFFAITFSIGAFFAGNYLSKAYHAEAFVAYQEDSSSQLTNSYQLNRLSLPTVVSMMRLPSHLKAVKSILGLDIDMEELTKAVSIPYPVARSNFVKISCNYRNPSLVVDIVNTLANVVVKHSEDVNRRQLQAAFDYFREEREIAKENLSLVTQQIAEFKIENPHFQMNSGNSSLVQEAAIAESDYEQAVLGYNSLLVEYENLKREASRVPDHIVQYAYEDSPLKDRIAKTEMELLEARTRYSPDNPKVKILESTLEELRKMVSDASISDAKGKVYQKNPLKEQLNIELMRFQGKLRSIQRTKEDRADALELSEKKLKKLPREQMKFVKMLQKSGSIEDQIKNLDSTLRSTSQMMSLGTGDIQLYHMADSAKSVYSKWDKIIDFFPLIGFVGGFCFGIGVAMFIEAVDSRFCTPKQLGFEYSAPCLKIIPEISRLAKRKNIEERTLFYMRTLYDHLKGINQQKPIQSVCFTSASKGEGKSTVATLFSSYTAKKLGKRVVFLEMDSQPNALLSDKECVALEDYLRGSKTLSEVITQSDEEHSFDRIKLVDQSDIKELVQSDRMKKLYTHLREKYDLVVIESPSVIDTDYSVDVARFSEMNLFVVGSSNSRRAFVDTALEELEMNGIGLDGFVLNRVPSIYVSDLRVLAERKKNRFSFWKRFFGGKSKIKNS